jgi:drug/metabolite transporter (DMT)-like permease
MSPFDLASIILLPALWAGSFVLQRVIVPEMGVFPMTFWRLVIAGATLLVVIRFLRIPLDWRRHWRAYFLCALMMSGLPWIVIAFASLHLPAAYISIISATSPLWATVIGLLLYGERITPSVVSGIATGISGIAVITWRGDTSTGASFEFWLALGGMLALQLMSGFAAIWIKRVCAHTQSHALSTGTMVASAILLLPAAAIPMPKPMTSVTVAQMLVFAVVCSAFAQLLYFRLLTRVTPVQALATTYLNPAFTAFWAWLFLSEPITWRIVVGSVLVLGGTSLITLGKAKPKS